MSLRVQLVRSATLHGKACSGERGSSLVEFVLCFALFWVPFFFGMWDVGISLIRSIQVAEVCRDAAHMLAFGIDFSDPSNQTMLQTIAQGLNLTTTGQSVVILSVVTYVNSSSCTNAGLSNCANTNQYVLIKRVVVGNSSVRLSAYGNPPSTDMDSSGNIAPGTYMTDAACVAAKFSNLFPVVSGTPTLAFGQYAYMAETTLTSPDLGGGQSSARSVF